MPPPRPVVADPGRRPHYPPPHNSQPIWGGEGESRPRVLRPGTGAPGRELRHPVRARMRRRVPGVAGHRGRRHGWAVTESLCGDDLEFAPPRAHLLGRQPARWTSRRRPGSSSPRSAPPDLAPPIPAHPRRPWRAGQVTAIAAGMGHLRDTADRGLVDELIRINQETLFDDMRNDAVHAEIWPGSALETPCRGHPGRVERADHALPGPLLGSRCGTRMWELTAGRDGVPAAYLATMRACASWAGSRPVRRPVSYVEAGRCFLRLCWRSTRHDVYCTRSAR